ncbi:DUF4381 domain-containing protein [Marinobacter sp.]|uniref:DUF4381 domain-containing protein n=1 Tax=Marinobacter sp. TaxID=50741 RepID=UPI0019A2FA35|nr:DUF4381 domain-containing protein [Marinobacter sp.]MBC7191901.1 DUF4381 domain-containing protein [Marinobacter sp.]
MNPQDPLSQLRDIHLPDPGGFWPPAPGWWVLTALLLAALVFLAIRLLRRWQRQRWKKAALAELERLAGQPRGNERWFAALNEILKRSAMACYPDQYPQTLSGEQWTAFLIDTWPDNQEPPRALLACMVQASWQPDTPCPADEALAVARFWIRRQSC